MQSELDPFKMKLKGDFAHTSEFRQPHLGYAPEGLKAFNMGLPGNKLISSMVYTNAFYTPDPQGHRKNKIRWNP